MRIPSARGDYRDDAKYSRESKVAIQLDGE